MGEMGRRSYTENRKMEDRNFENQRLPFCIYVFWEYLLSLPVQEMKKIFKALVLTGFTASCKQILRRGNGRL